MAGIFGGKQIADNSITYSKLNDDVFQSMPIALSDEVMTIESSGLKSNISASLDGTVLSLIGKDGIVINSIDFGNIIAGIVSGEVVDGVIIFTLSNDNTVEVDVSDLITQYTASGYINIDNVNNITLNYNLLTDNLLNDNFVNDLSSYYTSGEVDNLLLGKLNNNALDDYITLSTNQVIFGQKRFDNNLLVGGMSTSTSQGTGAYIGITGQLTLSGLDNAKLNFKNSNNNYVSSSLAEVSEGNLNINSDILVLNQNEVTEIISPEILLDTTQFEDPGQIVIRVEDFNLDANGDININSDNTANLKVNGIGIDIERDGENGNVQTVITGNDLTLFSETNVSLDATTMSFGVADDIEIICKNFALESNNEIRFHEANSIILSSKEEIELSSQGDITIYADNNFNIRALGNSFEFRDDGIYLNDVKITN